MTTQVDLNKVAKGLRARRRGPVRASGGYFGAMQLLADVEARFRVPRGGGRPTDPNWTERRLVPLAPRTLKRLEEIAARLRERAGTNLQPMQLAALLLERTTERINENDAEELLRQTNAGSR